MNCLSVRSISAALLFVSLNTHGADGPGTERAVGLAKVDITPDYAVRLSGYGNRREPSEGVVLRIWAKAMAIGSDEEKPAVLLTVDNCGIPDAMRAEVLSRLGKKAGITSDRIAICFSHTHCGPCLAGALVNIFSTDVPPEHQSAIDRYSRELTDKLEQVALAALADRKPAHLSWATGSAKFARNRRAAWGGPVDHALPVMFVHDDKGALRGVFANYACHATTLSFNKIHGDWPGTAMVGIERDHPGCIALIGIGCGADQNPHPRGTEELAVKHGEEIATEVARLLAGEKKPITGKLGTREKVITLPLAPLPSHEEWQKLAASPTKPIAYAAQKNLARLDRGEKIPTELPYRVQVWNFGSDLAMAFFPGEITVDYELRLKVEYDASRLWVNGYSNDALCYIPSERVLNEGGYEGGMAMVYYDRPNKFAPGLEDRIISAARELLPKEFESHVRADVPPRPPAGSLAAIKTHENLVVELMAAEPFVADPVAIDWDARGRMWVVEQPDYPQGMDGNWKPGGRVKILTDTDGDGRYDKAELFLEGIPFPTGVTCWHGGALVCAAPDILYAEDTNGDGKADKIEKLYTGFYTDNYNARINSLTLGLDNWIHAANGLLGGKITSTRANQTTDISGRDIRIRPDTGELQLVAGLTQQGLTRDDWDNWFGCSNSRWIFHFPMPDENARRNPHVPAPSPSVYLPAEGEDVLHPISKPLERFNGPSQLGHITSACGLGIYRDVLLGDDYAGNAFIGEVAHNLVRRYRLEPDGATFKVSHGADEATTEFLASTDNWTRPVQIRTGPDGALYIVDMYRAVIEHTRWIPADRLAKIDPRAGDTMGRIYRVYPRGAKLRPVRDLTQLDGPSLVAALDTPNGTVRDLVHQLLLHRTDVALTEPLKKLAANSKLSAVRVQALAILDGVHALDATTLEKALTDNDAHVRRQAVRLAGSFDWKSKPTANSSPSSTPDSTSDRSFNIVRDSDFGVRYELALALGTSDDTRATNALAELANSAITDPWMRAAVISSSATRAPDVLAAIIKAPDDKGRAALLVPLIATAAATAAQPADFEKLLTLLAPTSEKPAGWQIDGMGKVQDALDRRRIKLASLNGADKVRPLFEAAHRIALDDKAPAAAREDALQLFGRGFSDPAADMAALAQFLKPGIADQIQNAALQALGHFTDAGVAEVILADWSQRTPSMRTAMIGTLMSREDWIMRMLKAVADGVMNANEISTYNREALRVHNTPTIRDLSLKLFPVADSAARTKVVANYQLVASLTGDALKGAVVFKNVCSTCHAYLGQGNAVGPDLKAFYNKSASDFVTAILNPNAAIEPRYAGYVVTTKDNRTLTGVIANESAASLEVVQPGGLKETLLRTDVREIKATGLSLMPEGLEAAMKPQDMADLISYLKSGG